MSNVGSRERKATPQEGIAAHPSAVKTEKHNDNIKCWRACSGNGSPLRGWWGWKMVPPLASYKMKRDLTPQPSNRILTRSSQRSEDKVRAET